MIYLYISFRLATVRLYMLFVYTHIYQLLLHVYTCISTPPFLNAQRLQAKQTHVRMVWQKLYIISY